MSLVATSRPSLKHSTAYSNLGSTSFLAAVASHFWSRATTTIRAIYTTSWRLSFRRLGRHKVTASLLKPESAAEWREARRLVEEYASSLNLDLSFQNFAQELEHFESEYSPPSGAFLLAREKSGFVGCVGLRKLSDTVGEIKRLYVAPTARGLGLGEALVRGIVDVGKQLEYTRLVLDTLP